MKKTIIFLFAILMLVASCGEKNKYTIAGKVPNTAYEGQKVYLQELDSLFKDRVTVDSATIQNGAFQFTGVANNGQQLRFIVLEQPEDNMKRPVIVILEPGNIELTLDSVSTIKGTAANDAYQAYNTKVEGINAQMKALYEESLKDTANVALQADLEKKFDEQDALMRKELYDYTKANIANPAGAFLFITRSYSFDVDQLKELLAGLKPEYKQNERVQNLEKRVQALDATAVGKPFVDIKGLTPEGKEIALSDFAGKGKYVLVDFWASWCPPCRKDMPLLVDAYKKYKGKDFEIVGVSLDNDKAAWEKGIKTLNITWPQMSDLKGWQSELSNAYGVSSIPHTVLIDKEGKIIVKNVHAKDLDAKLKELLK